MAEPGPGTHHPAHPHAAAPQPAPPAHGHTAPLSTGDDGAAVGSARSGPGFEALGATGDVSPKKLAHADEHKCSACASCCSAAVIGSTVLNVPAPGVTPTVFSAVVPTVEKFSSDGPDRPPRVLIV